jgi:hypothetical protein
MPESAKPMRLGKHEKAILSILSTWSSVNAGWTWQPGNSLLRSLAEPEDIERFEQGNLVPLWMLRRDMVCGKTVLARALATLQAKGLILNYSACLDLVCGWEGFSKTHTKFVGLTRKGEEFGKKMQLRKVSV